MSCVARFTSVLALAASAVVFFSPASDARAGTLDLSAFGWTATFDDNVDLTVLSTSNNGVVLSLQKFADFTNPSDTTGVPETLNIVFRQTARNAVKQIAIEEETVLNDSGVDWSGFRFLLSGGVNGNTPSFDTEASSGFSTDPFGAKEFLNANKELRVSGGTLSSAAGSNIWRPGRSAGALFINAAPFSSGSLDQNFVFSEQPILGSVVIPLPAAAWTTLSGLLAGGLLVVSRKFRSALQ